MLPWEVWTGWSAWIVLWSSRRHMQGQCAKELTHSRTDIASLESSSACKADPGAGAWEPADKQSLPESWEWLMVPGCLSKGRAYVKQLHCFWVWNLVCSQQKLPIWSVSWWKKCGLRYSPVLFWMTPPCGWHYNSWLQGSNSPSTTQPGKPLRSMELAPSSLYPIRLTLRCFASSLFWIINFGSESCCTYIGSHQDFIELWVCPNVGSKF